MWRCCYEYPFINCNTSELQRDYRYTQKTEELVPFTQNGEGDLVVRDIETYNRQEKMLKLREELLAIEEDRMVGRMGCTLDELDAYLDDVITEV